MTALPLIIGILYLILGLFGVLENLLAAVLIFKDDEFWNPTYYCMFHHALCEAILSFVLGLYTGLASIFPLFQDAMACRFVAYLLAIGFFTANMFLILMSFVRCCQFVWTWMNGRYFSKRNLVILSFLFYGTWAAGYLFVLFHSSPIFSFHPRIFTWKYADDPIGRIALIWNLVWNIACLTLVLIFNVRSLIWVRRTRSRIRSPVSSTAANRKREINLFVQCAATGITYFVCSVLFYAVAFTSTNKENVVQSIATHFVWIAIHLRNPPLYLVANAKLRNRFLRLIGWNGGSGSARSVA